MQSTGQTSTQDRSFTFTHGSAMMYGIALPDRAAKPRLATTRVKGPGDTEEPPTPVVPPEPVVVQPRPFIRDSAGRRLEGVRGSALTDEVDGARHGAWVAYDLAVPQAGRRD